MTRFRELKQTTFGEIGPRQEFYAIKKRPPKRMKDLFQCWKIDSQRMGSFNKKRSEAFQYWVEPNEIVYIEDAAST
jgi:hypothetical protein